MFSLIGFHVFPLRVSCFPSWGFMFSLSRHLSKIPHAAFDIKSKWPETSKRCLVLDNYQRFHMPQNEIEFKRARKTVSDVLYYLSSLLVHPSSYGEGRLLLWAWIGSRPAGDQPASAGPRETLPQQTQRRPLTAPHTQLYTFSDWGLLCQHSHASNRHKTYRKLSTI